MLHRKSAPAAILPLTRESLEAGTRHLRAADPRLGRWMDRVGEVAFRRQRHPFPALCRSIISQQVGAKAAATIHGRFLERFAPTREPSPARLLELREAELSRCGLSRQKRRYLRALAMEFHQGKLGRVKLSSLPDAQVIEQLTRLPGIGVWTAEMFLIFCLGRQDVFSVRDLALRMAAARVAARPLTPAQVERAARRWAPYRSVASLYLWKIAHWREGPPGRA